MKNLRFSAFALALLVAFASCAQKEETPEKDQKENKGEGTVAWQPIAALRVSAGVATLGTSVASEDGNKYQQPASGRLGVNWGLVLAKDHAIDLMASGDVFFSGKVSGALGVQYGWRKMLFARCGYRLSSAACALPSHLGLGLGVCFHGFRLDVSYLTASKEVANTLAVGLGYNF